MNGTSGIDNKSGSTRLSSSSQDRRPSLRRNGFDEENPFPADDVSGSDADLDATANEKSAKSISEGDGRPPQFELPKYTLYDKFLLLIGVAAPFLVIFLVGELNRSQAWVFMNRWLVRDIDNQVRCCIVLMHYAVSMLSSLTVTSSHSSLLLVIKWYYNVWALQNQSNATLYSITSRMQGLAGVYPAVTSTSESVAAPFVTLSQFEAYGQDIRQDDQVLFVSYSPYIANDENRTSWEEYSVANQGWIKQSYKYLGESYTSNRIIEYIWYYNNKGSVARAPLDAAPYAPSWQSSPPPSDARSIVNQDFTQSDVLAPLTAFINQVSAPILSAPVNVDSVYGPNVVKVPTGEVGTTSVLMLPVYDGLNPDPSQNEIVGFLSGVIPWSTFFEDILPSYIVGIQVVVESCNDVNSTFQVNGPDVVFVGPGDQHDPQYDNWVVVSSFADFGIQVDAGSDNACPHTLYFFRTDAYYSVFLAAVPETTVLTITILCSFIVVAAGYATYDYFLRLRFKNRVRIANENYFREKNGDGTTTIGSLQFRSKSKANKLSRGGFDGLSSMGRSSGGMFKEATVLFADVVGLEEWSSVRDPSEVFALLETLYGAFDAIAERSSDVYKVDTFGDNYVAVCGAPVRNRDHPSIICLFARECLEESKAIFRSLAKQLGKDVKDLSVRFGLASGQVMASIVAGDDRNNGPRLQLSGDTVSTANYIKNTGSKGMIHLAEETASLLIASGRRNLINEVRSHSDSCLHANSMKMQRTALTLYSPLFLFSGRTENAEPFERTGSTCWRRDAEQA
jgi:class 3 adenylate cyclase